MFGWLAKMLLQTPVSSSGCACCEAKREHLDKMRNEITGENRAPEEFGSETCYSSGSLHIHIGTDGRGSVRIEAGGGQRGCAGDRGENCCGDGSCGCGRCHH